jgi:hypothetical protein
MNRIRFAIVSCVLAGIAVFLSDCGGSAPATGTLPVASAPPAGTSTFSTTSAAQTVPLPPTAGFTGRTSIPGVLGGTVTTVTLFAGISPPSGTPIMQGTATANQPAPIPLMYVAMTPAAEVQFSSAPSFTLALPAELPTSGFNFFIGYFDPANALDGYQPAFEGPASVSGQTLTFSQNASGLTFKAGRTYSFSLYEVPLPSPSPQPS